MGPQVQPKCFRHSQHMRNNWELRKRGYLIRFGHTEALLLKKNMTLNGPLPALHKLTHVCRNESQAMGKFHPHNWGGWTPAQSAEVEGALQRSAVQDQPGHQPNQTKSNQDQPGNISFECFIRNSMILDSFSGRDKAKTLQKSIICLWLLNNIEGERIEWCISSKLFQNKPSKLCESISIFLINLFISQGCQSL